MPSQAFQAALQKLEKIVQDAQRGDVVPIDLIRRFRLIYHNRASPWAKKFRHAQHMRLGRQRFYLSMFEKQAAPSGIRTCALPEWLVTQLLKHGGG